MSLKKSSGLKKSIGTWEAVVASVALVVAASTLVSDFTGYFTFGIGFAAAVLIGFGINLLLGLSAANLGTAYPRAGALYDYAQQIFAGNTGKALGIFFGLIIFSMCTFAVSGESVAGAVSLQAILDSEMNIRYYVLALSLLALIPNLFGIKSTAWFSAALLILMLGIRWVFGISGFLGISQTGQWTWEHLTTGVDFSNWLGNGGIITTGLALAIWGFLGIEAANSLAEEMHNPRKSLPRGIVLGLLLILLTSLVMGVGVTGTAPLETWQAAMNSRMGGFGESPQMAVGELMFGNAGRIWMGIASVSATLGSLVVLFAVMSRIIYSIARDGRFFGPMSRPIGNIHPRTGTPVNATLLTFVVNLLPAFYSSEVIEWVFTAAYLWIILFIVFHGLVIAHHLLHPSKAMAFGGKLSTVLAAAGILFTLAGLYIAFAGSHLHFGWRVLLVMAIAGFATFIAMRFPARQVAAAEEFRIAVSAEEITDDLFFNREPVYRTDNEISYQR